MKKYYLFASLALFLLNSVVLRTLNISFLAQGLTYLSILLHACAGSLVLKKANNAFHDPIVFGAVSLMFGIVLSSCIHSVLFHDQWGLTLGAASLIGFMLIGVVAAAGCVLNFKHYKKLRVMSPKGVFFSIFIAFLISVITAYGFWNNDNDYIAWDYLRSLEATRDYVPAKIERPVHYQGPTNPLASGIPNWGWNHDRTSALLYKTALIASKKFPDANRFPCGVHSFLMPQSFLINFFKGSFNTTKIVWVSKMITFVLFFTLLYMFYYLSRRHFRLSKNLSVLVLFSVVLFSPINYPVFPIARPAFNGFYYAAYGLYHSITQLFAFNIGLSGLLLIIPFLQKKSRTLFPGCLLVAATYLYRPSFFFMAVPAVFLTTILYKRFHKERSFGYETLSLAVLFLAPLISMAYGAILKPPQRPFDLAVKPFWIFFNRTEALFPDFITRHTFLWIGLIFLFSFAAFIPAIGVFFMNNLRMFLNKRRAKGRQRTTAHFTTPAEGRGGPPGRQDCEGAQERPSAGVLGTTGTGGRGPEGSDASGARFTHTLFWLILLFGIVTGSILVEDTQRIEHGNVQLLATTAYMLLLPLFYTLITQIHNRALSMTCWILVAFHLSGGFRQFYLIILGINGIG